MFAQNMVYSHTVNVYDRDFQRVAQLPDTVDLSAFGHPGAHQGGPVEAALSADGRHMYVTNYQMYGPGFGHPGNDKCAAGTSWDPSYVYRIALDSLTVDQIIQVGPVPKYIATTPDGRWVLNSNWCGDDLSVIDAASGKEVRRVPLGRYPRGIAVTPDSRTAYVAVMGSSDIAVVDLRSFGVEWIRGVGRGPRHLVMDATGTYLYATLNAVGQVAKIATATNTVVAKVASPSEPRSMTISPDGTALYVVNYASDAISKIRTSDMHQIQRLAVNHHPIGIAYDAGTNRVWVACYSGSIVVFDDR
jgi:YVTN family beta-propeller protein